MRYLIASIAFVLLSGCASDPCSGYMGAGIGEDKTIYSPYYELEQKINDGDLVARLVITLGLERIPQGYENTDSLTKHCGNGVLPWVSEIYFINKSGSEITIAPKRLSVGAREKTFSDANIIPTGKWIITEPLVDLASNYGTEVKASFEFIVNGEVLRVDGLAKRLSMEDLARKYQPK